MMEAAARGLALVAHRGYPAAFPENTLLGYQQAVAHGATFVETDVQCTRDGVPVLYHDAGTRRVSGVGGTISGRTLEQVRALSAHHPGRFGDRFLGNPVSTLEAFAAWLAQHPAVTAFVEIKEHSLEVMGIGPATQAVMSALAGVEERCAIISFDDRCVEHAAGRYDVRTGWVLPRWNARVEARARALSPDYLFAEDRQLPSRPDRIWQGPWEWAVYVVNELPRALDYVRGGIRLVETDTIGDLLDQYRAGLPATP